MNKGKNFSDEITRAAYDLYEKRGKVHGYAMEDWLRAEKMVLKGEGGQTAKASPTKTKKFK